MGSPNHRTHREPARFSLWGIGHGFFAHARAAILRRVFPRRIAKRPLPTRHLALVRRAVPVLRYLEKFINPRWRTPFEATKRLVGTVVVLLGTTLLLSPIPFSNVVPALAIALISLAYLEEDGVLLLIALLGAATVLAVAVVAVWQTILGAQWISGLW